MSNIDIINYGFGHASPKPRSGFVPALIERACGIFFKSMISEWKTAAVPVTARGTITAGVKNCEEVLQAVTALAIETACSQWNDRRTITVGGDHSQGFATIKATLLVAVIRAIISGEISLERNNSHLQDSKTYSSQDMVLNLAHKGQWKEVAACIDNWVSAGIIDQKNIRKLIDRFTVIWVDAHGDFNTKDTSDTKNFHGMSLAAACGLPAGGIEDVFGTCIRLNPTKVYVIGARDIDAGEHSLMQQWGVNFVEYDMHDLNNPKIKPEGLNQGQPISAAIGSIIQQAERVILSVDIDHLHHTYAPATGTALKEGERVNRFNQAPPGVSLEDSLEAFFNIMNHPKIASVDLTESGFAIGSNEAPQSDNLRTIYTTITILANMLGCKQTVAETIVAESRQDLELAVDQFVQRNNGMAPHFSNRLGANVAGVY